uniref:hypothetical protein n=1 Tax=Alloprevotella sp. TaxID=1872471 RepID=UPI003FEF3BF1
MNNEETIVMKPQNNNKAEQTENVEATTAQKSNKVKPIVTTAAAGIVGGVVGAGAAYAADGMSHGKEIEEQKPEDEAQTAEVSNASTAEASQDKQQVEPQVEAVETKADDTASEGPDYTNLNNANPMTPNPEVEAVVDESSNDDANGVQVLGVYDVPGENGQNTQAAVLTNGEEYAVVADIDGDGVADVLGVDENHTQQIEEYEVYDISNECVQMSNFQNAVDYEQQQQEQETFVYNANDDLSEDYNNHADINYEA